MQVFNLSFVTLPIGLRARTFCDVGPSNVNSVFLDLGQWIFLLCA